SGLPDAIFAANDMIAIGVLHALHENGLRVPEDVAVVGFDNTLGAEFLIPSLTTAAQPFAGVGRAALRTLVMPLGERASPAPEPPPARAPPPRGMVSRRSTRPARTHRAPPAALLAPLDASGSARSHRWSGMLSWGHDARRRDPRRQFRSGRPPRRRARPPGARARLDPHQGRPDRCRRHGAGHRLARLGEPARRRQLDLLPRGRPLRHPGLLRGPR